MFRYILLVWDVRNSQQDRIALDIVSRIFTSSSAAWEEVLSENGLRAMCTDAQRGAAECRRLSGRTGVVLGTLFARDLESTEAVRSKPVLDEFESDAIVSSCGRRLIDSYWGSYVAVIRSSDTRKIFIIRSPAGALPCLHSVVGGVHVYFSYLPDFSSLGVLDLSINWRYIARHVLKITHLGETGLTEVTEVECGECVEIATSHVVRHRYWDPLTIALSEPLDDAAAASRAMRDTVTGCVRCWASCYPRLLLRLSGGLDSSIVLGCLRHAPSIAEVLCVIRHSPGSDSDERAYASLAARHTMRELVELPRDSAIRLEDMFSARMLERPHNFIIELGQTRSEVRLAQARGATAIFGGDFGDQVFYSSHAQLSVADFMHDHGLGTGLLSVLLSASRITGLSVWPLLSDALKKNFVSFQWDPVTASRTYHTLINENAARELQALRRQPLPWVRKGIHVPPGKQFHVFSMMSPGGYYSAFERTHEPAYIVPLMSQPIVELCLRIPTYVLASNGWDREIARSAFVDDVPAEILRRRSKGGQEQYTNDLFRKNRDFIRELLLNGGLVREGLLDKAKVEQALTGRPSNILAGTGKLSQYISVEAWLKICAAHRVRSAA